jgi:endo-1,4-beta-xylanase
MATPTVNPAVASLSNQESTSAVNPAKAVEQPAVNLPATGKYTDIYGHWAAQNILHLINTGIISGYPDGTIKPDHKITRAEMITLLIKALGVNTGNTDTEFTDKEDIPPWAFEYVCYAARNGIIKGYEDNTVRPNSLITRSEMAVITVNAFSLSTDGEKNMNFSDIKNIPVWAEEYVSAAFRSKILKGYADNTIRPLSSITRAEAFVMLQRAIESRTS